MISNQELTMLRKVEPLSPSGSSSFDIDEEWLCFEEKPPTVPIENQEDSLLDGNNVSRSEAASKLLEQLEVYWIKEEEPFANWFEEKIDIPIYEELPGPENVVSARPCINDYPTLVKQQLNLQQFHQPHQLQQQQQQQQLHHEHQQPHHEIRLSHDTTQSLLQEFENVLGDVEACHNSCIKSSVSTLTPPQTPPPPGQILVALQPVQQKQHQQHQLPAYLYDNHVQQQQLSPHQLLQLQLQPQGVLQPYANQLPALAPLQNQWGAENLSLSPLVVSPAPSESNGVQQELAEVEKYVRSCAEDAAPSSPFATSSETCSSEDSSEDPDWSMGSASTGGYSDKADKKGKASAKSRNGRKARPYSRPNPEDKRMRKKEQNKNAATRYRQKKKQEIKEIIGEEQELINYNEKLQTQANDLQREIGYLKGLMRDLCKAKGLIK